MAPSSGPAGIGESDLLMSKGGECQGGRAVGSASKARPVAVSPPMASPPHFKFWVDASSWRNSATPALSFPINSCNCEATSTRVATDPDLGS